MAQVAELDHPEQGLIRILLPGIGRTEIPHVHLIDDVFGNHILGRVGELQLPSPEGTLHPSLRTTIDRIKPRNCLQWHAKA
jgi:hypothetical protein